MDEDALAALSVAGEAIQGMKNITSCSVDGDHKSGEIIFTTVSGNHFILRLEEFAGE